MIINRLCPYTGEVKTMDIPVTDEHIEAWKSGQTIQDAMPELTPDQREFILTGITSDIWDEVFGEDDDEDDDDETI